ncbi:MAG: tetratricopeptide repeat protein [Balneolales bacterium]
MKHLYYFIFAAFLFVIFGLPSNITAQEIPKAVNEDYHEALRLYDDGLFESAYEYFNRFINKYPESSLNENARYHLALSNAQMDEDNKDIYFEEFIRHYPLGFRAVELLTKWANNKYEGREFGDAMVYYGRAFDLNKNAGTEARLYYRMAEASVELGNIRAASQYYLDLAENHPNDDLAPAALYARGRLYLNEERYQASTDAFELLRENYPNHDLTRRVGTALGESYFQQGRYEEAIASLENAIQYLEGESESKAILLIAESYNYLDQLQRAISYYRRYINLNKGNGKAALAHYGLGWVYHKQQVYHWAAESYGNAATGNDDEISRKALYYKAVNEKLSSRYDLAMETFQEFGDLYQDGFWVEEAYYEWAVTAFEMSNHVKSLEVLLSLIRSDVELDSAGEVLTLLGESYFANNEFTRAIQAFEEAEKLGDASPGIQRQAKFQRAWVQYQNQAYDAAQPTFQTLYEESSSSELSGEALFWSADSYYNMENWSRASNQFDRFLREYPNHEFTGAARYSLGWSYFKLGSYDQAVGPLVAFLNDYEPPPIALYPYDVDTRLRVADSHFALSNYDEAISYYEEAVGEESGGDYALFQIGNSYHRDEQTFEAVSTFRRLIRIFPFSQLRVQAHYNIGYIYFLTGNYTQAIEEFNSLIDNFPNSSWAARSQYNIGDAYYNAADYEDAIVAYRNVLEDYPRSDYIIESINGIQFSQSAAGEDDSSREVMEDFLDNHPQAGTADRLRYQLAQNQMQSGNHEDAISSFRNYMRTTNSDQLISEAQFNIGEAYERLNDESSAIREYQRLIGDYPDSDRAGEALLNLGRLYQEREEFRLSASSYDALINHSPALRLEALAGAGNAYIGLGENDRAQERFMNALNQDSNHEDSQLGIGKVALAKRNYNEAERIFREIADVSSASAGAEAQYHLGLVHQEQGNYNEALRAFSNVRILFEGYDDWDSKSLLQTAECHIALGARNEAQNVLQQIIDSYPDSKAATEASSLLNNNQ